MAIEVKKFLDANGVGKIHELVNTAMENYATNAGVVYHINGITVTVTHIGNGHLSVATSGMDSLLTDGVYTINGYNYICRVNQVATRTWVQEIYIPFNPIYLDGNKMPKTVGWYRSGNQSAVGVTWSEWQEMYYANDSTQYIEIIEKDADGKYELDGTINGHSYLLQNLETGYFDYRLFKSTSGKEFLCSSHGGTLSYGQSIIVTVWHAITNYGFFYCISLDGVFFS